MSIDTLEKTIRRALKGENVSEKSSKMLSTGLISPAEHRSLESLSFQIAANVSATKDPGTLAFVRPNGTWI